MNNGPVISSSVGRLMAWTLPQKWPLLSPRSRNHLPPGQGSSFIGIALPSGVSFADPICSSNAAKVVSRLAGTSISWGMFSIKLSIPAPVAIIVPPSFDLRSHFIRGFASSLGPLLNSVQLVLPETFERLGPVIKGTDGIRVGSVKHAPPVASHLHQADIPQDPQVFGHRRLLHAKAGDNIPDGPLLPGEIVQNVPPPRLSHRVESIRGRSRPRHGSTLHSHIGICQEGSLPLPRSQ